MRKEYSRVLRTLFTKKMKVELPEFVETKVKSIYFFPGDRAFAWAVSKEIVFWIILSPSKKDYDEFNVLVGWSKLGRYPELSMVPCAERPSPERSEFAHVEYLTRLPYLWTRDDDWWVVKKWVQAKNTDELKAQLEPIPSDEALGQVEPVVDDCIQKLKGFAIPFFRELCNSNQDCRAREQEGAIRNVRKKLELLLTHFLSNSVSGDLLREIRQCVEPADVSILMAMVESLEDPSAYCKNDTDQKTVSGFFLFIDFVSALIINMGAPAVQEIKKYATSTHPFVPWVVKYCTDDRFKVKSCQSLHMFSSIESANMPIERELKDGRGTCAHKARDRLSIPLICGVGPQQ